MIQPKRKWLDFDLRELYHYRDLIKLFVNRDFVTVYKQTILGPLWFILNPLFSTIMYTFVFGGLAKIPTDGVPQTLFYYGGSMLWGYFSILPDQRLGHFHRATRASSGRCTFRDSPFPSARSSRT